MIYVKVWCEYDFSGNFGGNNNEDIFKVNMDDNIDKLVLNFLIKATGLDEEDLEDLYGWNYINISQL
jgi:hypothetical protein